MSPLALARAASAAGLQMIALTDHNTAENAPAFAHACERVGICPVFGVEATSSEEAHVLALFADPTTAVDFGRSVYASLPDVGFDPEKYGDQVVVDDDEMVVSELSKYLIGASSLSMAELGAMIHDAGGLYIPAHIDRASFSVWSQLGFLPPDAYDAVEIIGRSDRIAFDGFTAITSSDAHEPEQVARRSISFDAERPGFDALHAAIVAGRVDLHGLTE